MEEFDYIIVGGGTSGCVLAARLTERSDCSVLMLEAGGKDSSFWIPIPAGFTKLLTNRKYNWLFKTEPEENTYGREISIPRGKGLGGSSLINGMIFVRGQALDYDGWAQRGARGWSFEDVLPYFRKIENFEDLDGTGDSTRGRGGPINVVRVTERSPMPEAFLIAADQAGYPRNPDYNGADQNGFGWYQVNQRHGRRWSAADAYLRPALSRKNLSVRTEAFAQRIDFEGRRAVGVTYRTGTKLTKVRAKNEVILAAGSVQSPQLLEISGVGIPDVLKQAGVHVHHELRGVGENYIDHYATRMNWRVKIPVTLNEMTRGWRLGVEVGKYFLMKKGVLTLGTGLVGGFVKTRPGLSTPDMQYFFVHASYADASKRELDREPGMTIGVSQLRPESKGTIHIKTADPAASPSIRPNFLDALIDQKTLIEGMRIGRHIMDQPAMNKFRAFELAPGPDVQTDEQWLDFARRNGQTMYHPVGTCSMGQGGSAVVDERLRVHGLAGLRVVDASIMPTMVSGNTAAAVFMIAEKASDMIIADSKIKVSPLHNVETSKVSARI